MPNFNKSQLILFVLSLFIFNETSCQNKKSINLTISGKVTHSKVPLEDVTVIVNNTSRGTKTNDFGEYKIKVNKGDVLQFSHIGYSTVSITVEKEKKVNIELIPENFLLEEVALKKVKKKVEETEERFRPFKTAMGVIDPRTLGIRVDYVKGSEIETRMSISTALQSRIPSYQIIENRFGEPPVVLIRGLPVIWDVDGFVTDMEPPLIMENVESVRVLGSVVATNKYGFRCRKIKGPRRRPGGCGGVIVVTMKKDFAKKQTQKEKERIKTVLAGVKGKNSSNKYINNYSETIVNINNTEEAFEYCKKIINKKNDSYLNDLKLIYTFNKEYKEKLYFNKLVDEYSVKHSKDVNALRALAYELEVQKDAPKYLDVYKTIFKTDGSNPKSYRDLANAFIDNSQYDLAWRLYASHARKSKNFLSNRIDKLMFNEMEWLHFNNNSTNLLKFVPGHETKEDFAKDVRIVVEWDNPNVDFNLYFDNDINKPIEFNYIGTKGKQKNKPVLIEEFFIADLKNSKWNVNLSYFGKEMKRHTNMKFTLYYNWGKKEQFKEVKTFNVEGEFAKKYITELTQVN